MGPSPGLPSVVTGVMMPLLVSKLSEESLPAVMELVAMDSTLVYRDMVTEEDRIMIHALQLQGQDAFDQGHGVVITEL